MKFQPGWNHCSGEAKLKWLNKKNVLRVLSVVALTFLALTAGLVYFLRSLDFEQFVGDYIVGSIELRTGAQVSLESFDADFRGERLVLNGLVLRGDEGLASAPLVSIDSVEIGLGWGALLHRQIALSSLSIIGPRIRLTIDDEGATNIPTPPPRPDSEPASFQLSIGDFTVSGGSLVIGERRIDIDFSLAELEGRFEFMGQTDVLSGHVEYQGTVERMGRPGIPYALSADFDYTRGTLLVEAADLSSGQTSVTLEGRIDEFLGSRTGVLEYAGTVDLPFLNYFFTEGNLAGEMEVTGRLEFSRQHFAATGRATANTLSVEDWVATNMVSDYEYGFPERTLTVTRFQANVAGGRADGTARVLSLPGPSGRIELDLRYVNIDTSAFRRAYPWDRRYVVHSRSRGTLAGWFEGKFDRFDFSGDAAFEPMPADSVADSVSFEIAGSTAYRATPGTVEVTGLVAQFQSTRIQAEGRIDRDTTALDFTVQSDDLTDLDFIFDQANGEGEFDGVIRGRIGSPDLEGRFRVTNYDYDDWTIDRIAGDATLTSDQIDFRGVQIIGGDSELTLDGQYNLNARVPDLDIDIVRLAASDLRRIIGRPVDGEISGQLHVDSLDPFEFNGRLEATNLSYNGHTIGQTEADVVFGSSEIGITDVSVRQGEAALTGRFVLRRPSGAFELEVSSSGYTIEDLHWLGVPTVFDGVVRSAAFEINGTRDEPHGEGRADVKDFRFRKQHFEEAVIQLGSEGRLVHVDVVAGAELTLEAEFDMSRQGYPFRGNAHFADYAADQLAGLPDGLLTADGSASFEGQLLDLRSLEGSGEVTGLTVRFEERDPLVSRPFTFQFNADQVHVENIEFSDEAASVVLDGTVAVSEEAPLDLSVEGNVDLSLVAGGFSGLETRGEIVLDGEVGGTLANPELRGRATLNDVSLGHESLLLSLSSLNGDLFFDGNAINFNDIRGSAGGGEVIVQGTIGIEGFGPGVFDVRLDASNVRFRTSEGLRAVLDGALVLRGTAETPLLEGSLEVVNLSFDQDFEEFLELFGDRGADGLEPGSLDELALAIHVEGDRNIWIENEVASVDARLDLDFAGTFADPTLTGHIEATTGTLRVQDERYRITRGSIDFVNPLGIEPLIDVQAETELRDYRIILSFNGRGDDVRLEMRADPPLPQLEIVNLIAGGRTREELAESSAVTGLVPTSEELFRGGAATILADLLQERVGSRFGLLNRVRIDPFLVGAENNAVARVTISEQITRDLAITYSQDLSSNRQQIILIEYFLNNDTSFVATRDETGAFGLDIRLRTRLR